MLSRTPGLKTGVFCDIKMTYIIKGEFFMKIIEPELKTEDILIVDDRNFNQKNVCIITGCGSGIGRAVAIVAGTNDLTVVGLDINEFGGNKTVEIVKSFGGSMKFFKVDLTKDNELKEVVKQINDIGKIKYLSNIAGIQYINAIQHFPMEKYDLMQNLMLRAPFLLSQLTIPYMSAAGGGVIVNMASIHAHICTKHKSVYNITKFGLKALSQSISAEYEETKVRSFTVSTGFVRTPLALK